MPRARKLRLNRSTVRHLESQEMLEAVGGRPPFNSTAGSTCQYTCGGTCVTCPGGCDDPTIANTCGC